MPCAPLNAIKGYLQHDNGVYKPEPAEVLDRMVLEEFSHLEDFTVCKSGVRLSDIRELSILSDCKRVIRQDVVSASMPQFNTGDNDIQCCQSLLPLQPAHSSFSGNISRIRSL